MAKILGKAGCFASDETARLRTNTLIIGFVLIGMLGVVEGMTLSSLWSKLNAPDLLTGTVQWGIIGLVAAITVWGWRKMDVQEVKRNKWQRGADGESAVGKLIAKFPDDFYVINDINTGAGNLDHVVVGPTGVFVLDTKAWRGVVTADGKGELHLNGRPTDKPYVRQFVGRMMGVREKVLALAPGMEAHFNAVFVFTAARVEAKWGTTGRLHCITDEQIQSYIVETNFGKKLRAKEVGQIAQAFLGLAHMDREFWAGNQKQPGTSEAGIHLHRARGRHLERREIASSWRGPSVPQPPN